MNDAQPTSPFLQTRWTLVLRTRGETPEARAALGELCESYYQPVIRFLRREGRGEDEARELVQEFFARVLERGDMGAADPARGRFRSYLLGAVKHFLADHRDHAQRLKRGGGVAPESLEASSNEEPSGRAQVADTDAVVPDTYFDRQWALTVMDRALGSLQHEFGEAEKAEQFEALKPWLAGDSERLLQSEAAKRLGWSETAIKVAIHRLRKRFREMVRSEIGQTVAAGTDIDLELRYLVDVLSAT